MKDQISFDKSTSVSEAESGGHLSHVDPMVAALGRVQQQLAEQTRMLQVMRQELTALKEAQAAYHITLTKVERQLRWARWMRRIRSAIALLFWLGILAVLAYYWQDLSKLWNELSRFIL